MIVASFNVENMFRRPIALNQDTWAEGRPILEGFAALQVLLEKQVYTAADKKAILKHLVAYGLDKTDEGPMMILRRSRGQLVKRPRNGPIEVIASGRGDWIGWLELKKQAVNELATRHTAQVIGDLNADVLCVIEAEDRPALVRFNADVLAPMQKAKPATKDRWSYRQVMLIDGNDERGIDVGVMTKAGYEITRLLSHVDDPGPKQVPVFSRDCPEYTIATPAGNELLVLVNHFKSKGYGGQQSSNTRRAAQAKRVAEIYKARRADGIDHIIVLGDLNDTPDSAPLAALVANTDLRDVSTVGAPKFDDQGRPGTFATSKDKIDYLLCSPATLALVKKGGIFRQGVWRSAGVKNPWPMYPTITRPVESASDHAAIWAEIDL